MKKKIHPSIYAGSAVAVTVAMTIIKLVGKGLNAVVVHVLLHE